MDRTAAIPDPREQKDVVQSKTDEHERTSDGVDAHKTSSTLQTGDARPIQRAVPSTDTIGRPMVKNSFTGIRAGR